MTAGLTWKELLTAIAERLGEPDLFSGPALVAENDTPYFDPDVTEDWLYFVSLALLRQAPVSELQAIGSPAIAKVTGAPGVAIPLNAVKLLNAQIRVTNGGSYVPAEIVDLAAYEQQRSVAAADEQIVSAIAGTLAFKGDSVSATFLVEPAKSVFQADQPVLPAHYDEDRIDGTYKLLLAYDFLPMGRL